MSKHLQQSGTGHADKRAYGYIYICRSSLVTIETVFVGRQRQLLSEHRQVVFVLFFHTVGHAGKRYTACSVIRRDSPDVNYAPCECDLSRTERRPITRWGGGDTRMFRGTDSCLARVVSSGGRQTPVTTNHERKSKEMQ